MTSFGLSALEIIFGIISVRENTVMVCNCASLFNLEFRDCTNLLKLAKSEYFYYRNWQMPPIRALLGQSVVNLLFSSCIWLMWGPGEVWEVGEREQSGFFVPLCGLWNISSVVSSACTPGILFVLISASSPDISQLFFHPCKQFPVLNSFCLTCWNDFLFSWSDFVWCT